MPPGRRSPHTAQNAARFKKNELPVSGICPFTLWETAGARHWAAPPLGLPGSGDEEQGPLGLGVQPSASGAWPGRARPSGPPHLPGWGRRPGPGTGMAPCAWGDGDSHRRALLGAPSVPKVVLSPRPRESPVSGEARGRAAAPGTPQLCSLHPTSSCVLVLAGVKRWQAWHPRASPQGTACTCLDASQEQVIPTLQAVETGTAGSCCPGLRGQARGRRWPAGPGSTSRPGAGACGGLCPGPSRNPEGGQRSGQETPRAQSRPWRMSVDKGLDPSPPSSQTARHESWQYNVYFILKNKPKPPDPFPRGLLTELPGRAWLQPSRGR